MARGPIAQGFVDCVRLVGRLVTGREAKKDGTLSRAERRGQGAAETARQQRELRAGVGVLSSLGVLAVAGLVYNAMPDPATAPQPIDALKPSGPALREVFYGATPWVVECTSPAAAGRSVLGEAAAQRLLPSGLRAGRVACDLPLASGATILDLLKLSAPPPSAPPLLLQAGHGAHSREGIRRLSERSAASLARHLQRLAAPRVVALNSTLDLRRHCLSRPACLLLLTTGTASSSAKSCVLQSVGSSNRMLGVATINRRTHSASFFAQIPQTERPVLIALRPGRGRDAGSIAKQLTAEARAFKGAHDGAGTVHVWPSSARAAYDWRPPLCGHRHGREVFAARDRLLRRHRHQGRLRVRFAAGAAAHHAARRPGTGGGRGRPRRR